MSTYRDTLVPQYETGVCIAAQANQKRIALSRTSCKSLIMKKASTAMSSTLRCLKVLELLAEEPFELSFTELAARLDVPKASAHRLCATLIEANLIKQEPVYAALFAFESCPLDWLGLSAPLGDVSGRVFPNAGIGQAAPRHRPARRPRRGLRSVHSFGRLLGRARRFCRCGAPPPLERHRVGQDLSCRNAARAKWLASCPSARRSTPTAPSLHWHA